MFITKILKLVSQYNFVSLLLRHSVCDCDSVIGCYVVLEVVFGRQSLPVRLFSASVLLFFSGKGQSPLPRPHPCCLTVCITNGIF